jgi:riboflavin synthase
MRGIMFTGIIQSVGKVRGMRKQGIDGILEIETPMDMSDVAPGDSIAVSGVCLTVTVKGPRGFTADVSAETLSRTTLKSLNAGEPVNLEKAVRPDSFLGGHFVLGHVDGTAGIIEKTLRSGSILFGFEVPASLSRYIVEKGSIAVDGISLTVNRCEKTRFYVNIIPHTAENTTLRWRKTGDRVNIETDILGKYIEKLLRRDDRLDEDFLRKHGFIPS